MTCVGGPCRKDNFVEGVAPAQERDHHRQMDDTRHNDAKATRRLHASDGLRPLQPETCSLPEMRLIPRA